MQNQPAKTENQSHRNPTIPLEDRLTLLVVGVIAVLVALWLWWL
jgi:hypothetical protein